MTEPYPVVDERGEVRKYVGSSTEFTLLRSADQWGSEELFLWTRSRAYRVDYLVSEGFCGLERQRCRWRSGLRKP